MPLIYHEGHSIILREYKEGTASVPNRSVWTFSLSKPASFLKLNCTVLIINMFSVKFGAMLFLN